MLIYDEVQTGVGITGKMWAHQHFIKNSCGCDCSDKLSTIPDIIAFGKKTQCCGIFASKRIDEIEENVFTKEWWDDIVQKELLNEGGAYGHMAHPFDDKDLTFGDLKKIIENGLGGKLSREDNVTEKLDGQNLMISWRED